MEVFATRKEVREFRESTLASGASLGLVPTMGALHRGHLELVRRALEENDLVVVSIFVNPTQFDNPEDLASYPRDLSDDLEQLRALSPEISVFAPDVQQMYEGSVKSESIDLGGLDRYMEGAYRTGHFQGVATVVKRLLKTIAPDRAYFGEKDYQQLQIIRRLVKTEEIPVEIVACPIVREADGLAMSSRNRKLTKRLRKEAVFIYDNLLKAKSLFGTKSAEEILAELEKAFEAHPEFDLEYAEIAEESVLKPVRKQTEDKKYRAFVAAYLGGVRLIDNMALN